MYWTLVPWHVVWIHALILVLTLALACFLQIYNSRQERRQAAQRWERQHDAARADRSRLAIRAVSATHIFFTKGSM
ncbi:MAG: hypothetical protein VX346_03640 [Planctomycetota bacterium]|nr:hypothetical protein [Planctomycetota bacterium]